MGNRCLLSAEVAADKIDKEVYFTVAEDVAKRDHSVAALGNVSMDVLGGGIFIGFGAKVWNDLAVRKRFPLSLASMANSAVLTEQCCLIALAVAYDEAGGLTGTNAR